MEICNDPLKPAGIIGSNNATFVTPDCGIGMSSGTPVQSRETWPVCAGGGVTGKYAARPNRAEPPKTRANPREARPYTV